MLTTLVYSQVTPSDWAFAEVPIGMVAMVIGGLGNLRGAMIGGLAVGLLETFNDAYFNAGYLAIFSIFFAFLVLRPEAVPAPGGRS